MNDNIDKIIQSFSIQANTFESQNMNFSKQDYLDYTIKTIHAGKNDKVLEVASGTCVCGRSIAPFVASVVCIDATNAMLEIGKSEAKKHKISNIDFVNGYAEKLPFDDDTFDIVITRLSFHHFTEMEAPFAEMDRVLKNNGKLVIIDMEATKEDLRITEDKIETMRDFSHIKNRSKREFLNLYQKTGYDMVEINETPISVKLDSWMQLTKTPDDVRQKIISLMQQEINGGSQTGFFPYEIEGDIYFNQRWLMVVGIKNRMEV